MGTQHSFSSLVLGVSRALLAYSSILIGLYPCRWPYGVRCATLTTTVRPHIVHQHCLQVFRVKSKNECEKRQMVSLVWCSIVFRQGQKRFSCGWICFVIVLLFTEHRVVFVHAGENSPMKHSKPCAFRRCNATAETLALVLHFLQRVCKLVAIDEEQKPLLSEEETLRPDPPGFFTLKQIGTLQEWALTAQQFVDAQLGS